MAQLQEALDLCGSLRDAYARGTYYAVEKFIPQLPEHLNGISPNDLGAEVIRTIGEASQAIAGVLTFEMARTGSPMVLKEDPDYVSGSAGFEADCQALFAFARIVGLVHEAPLSDAQRIGLDPINTALEYNVATAFEAIAANGSSDQLIKAFELGRPAETQEPTAFGRLSPELRIQIITKLARNDVCVEEQTVLQIAQTGLTGIEIEELSNELHPLRKAITVRQSRENIGEDIQIEWNRIQNQIGRDIEARRGI